MAHVFNKTTSASNSVTAASLTTTEKKLIELYRDASSDNKKLATKVLKGDVDVGDILPLLKNANIGDDSGLLGNLLGKLQGLGK